jgi:hypothetical protein
LTRIPYLANSFAMDIVSVATAAFAPEYMPEPSAPPLWPATEPILTMLPLFCLRYPRAALVTRKILRTLVAYISS